MSREQQSRVLIVHDCLFAAESLSLGLSADPDIRVVDIVLAEGAIATATELVPDAILVYLTSPWPESLRVATAINARVPTANIILLGVPAGHSFILDSIKAGAKAALPKSASLQEVLRTLININKSSFSCSPQITHVMFRHLYELSLANAGAENVSATLTPRELEVVELLAENKSNQEIAASLHLSVHTVKKHVHNLLRKLRLRHRTQLVHAAESSGDPRN